jgi:hypothetical protein
MFAGDLNTHRKHKKRVNQRGHVSTQRVSHLHGQRDGAVDTSASCPTPRDRDWKQKQRTPYDVVPVAESRFIPDITEKQIRDARQQQKTPIFPNSERTFDEFVKTERSRNA